MAGILGGGSQPSSTLKRVTSFSVQSSMYGSVMPIGWGRARLGINIIWFNGFHAVKNQQTNGKGGAGDAGASYSYYMHLMLGIADTEIGPIRDVVTLYRDQDTFTDFLNAGFNGCQHGWPGQNVWTFLAETYPDEALGYDTTAFLYGSEYQLNDGGGLQNHSVEVDFNEYVEGFLDANPASITYQFLRHCVPQWNAEFIGDLTAYKTACLAQGLLLSPCLDSQQQASAFIDELMTATNSNCWVRGDGTLQVKSYADEEVTGNGETYTPDMTPVFDLTNDDFIVDDPADDPIKIDTENLDDVYNIQPVSFKDRDHQYNDNTVKAWDQASIDEFEKRRADPESLPCIKDKDIARLSAQLILQRKAHFRRPFVFKLPWCFDRLEEMDVGTISNPSQGINNVMVRIRQIDEDEDAGALTVYVDEALLGTGTAKRYQVQDALGGGIDRGGDGEGGLGGGGSGGDSNQIVFNAPLSLTNGELQVWAAIAGTKNNWGGSDIWISLDGSSYEFVGKQQDKSTFGYVMADVPSASTSTLDVDLSDSGGELLSATPTAFSSNASLCWINGELIAYRDAALIGTHQYRLTGLRRGLYRTQTTNHLEGTPFVLLDDTIFKRGYQSGQLGQSVFVKTPSFNWHGRNTQTLADIEPSSVALARSGNTLESVAAFLAEPYVEQTDAVLGTTAFWRLGIQFSIGEPHESGLQPRFEYQPPSAVGTNVWKDASPPFGQFTNTTLLISETGGYLVRVRLESPDGEACGPWEYGTVTIPAAGDVLTLGDGTPVTSGGILTTVS